ncbi:MAG: NAD(+)/NADH kinase [Anaerolineaceae bacterium]|nr:NAD(+)/NADH kinase [Anaerolineaceae bacterium]
MPEKNPIPHNIAIVTHPGMPEAIAEARQVTAFLSAQGANTLDGSLYDEKLRNRLMRHEFDMLIAVGGDGTMLRAGRLCAPLGVPVLGINLGRLGFLMEVHRNEWRERLPLLMEGRYWLEKRMMLRAEHCRGEQLLGAWEVVNEAVVSRGEIVRPVHVTAYVDGSFLTTYVADGLIASTPTGSTGYALAVGGPILPPQLRNILIIPVAPHLSVDRAVVLAEGSSVGIIVHTTHQAVLSVDGQAPLTMLDGDRVTISAGEHTLYFVHFQDPGYFYRNLTAHMDQNPSTHDPSREDTGMALADKGFDLNFDEGDATR